MPKSNLTLSIDTNLLVLARNSNINLSKEFEEWVKIRLNQPLDFEDGENIIDYDKRYAELKLELQKLELKKEAEKDKEAKDKEKEELIDHIIDNELEVTEAINIPEKRYIGLQFLYNKRFNINLNEQEAKDILFNRLQERGLIG